MTKLISVTMFLNKEEKELLDEFDFKIEKDQVFLRTIPANKMNVFKSRGFRKQGIIYLIKKYVDFKRSKTQPQRQANQPQPSNTQTNQTTPSEESIINNQTNGGEQDDSSSQVENSQEDSS